MTMTPEQQLVEAHDLAYAKACGCNVYAPKQGVDLGEALYVATRSGGTSARCGEEWMRLHSRMKKEGLVSTKYPHLFASAQEDNPGYLAATDEIERLRAAMSLLRNELSWSPKTREISNRIDAALKEPKPVRLKEGADDGNV